MRIAFLNGAVAFGDYEQSMYYHTLVQGMIAAARDEDAVLSYYDESASIADVMRNNVDGIIATVPRRHSDYGKEPDDIPLIHCMLSPPYRSWYAGSDETMGIERLLTHLRMNGYRRIAFFGFGPESYVKERYTAFRRCASLMGLLATPHRYGMATDTRNGEFFSMASQTMLSRLCGRIIQDRPEALICATDRLACHFLDFAAARGLRIPGDIAVAGFDGNESAAGIPDRRAGMTTVRQDFFAVGAAAVQMTAAVIRSERTAQCVQIPPKLIVRRSTERKKGGSGDFARGACTFLAEHASDSRVIHQAALEFARSPAVFSRSFTRAVGMSPIAYLTSVRLSRAASQLRSSDTAVITVAFTAGFKTHQHFDRLFKRTYGESPNRYRARYRRTEQDGSK